MWLCHRNTHIFFLLRPTLSPPHPTPPHPSRLSFIYLAEAEAEAPRYWPPDAKSWLIGKNPDAGKDWRREEKGTTEDEMVGWHHRLNGPEFEQAPGVGDGLGGLACCSLWGRKEWDTTEQRNWTELGLGWPTRDLNLWHVVTSSLTGDKILAQCTGSSES